jgi:hypothetical protein
VVQAVKAVNRTNHIAATITKQFYIRDSRCAAMILPDLPQAQPSTRGSVLLVLTLVAATLMAFTPLVIKALA